MDLAIFKVFQIQTFKRTWNAKIFKLRKKCQEFNVTAVVISRTFHFKREIPDLQQYPLSDQLWGKYSSLAWKKLSFESILHFFRIKYCLKKPHLKINHLQREIMYIPFILNKTKLLTKLELDVNQTCKKRVT